MLVVHAQRFSQFPPNEQVKFFAVAGADAEWEVPYGMTYNALAAMVTQGYMSATGTTIEQVASVCVANRRWANLQPNAMFYGRPITVEEVLGSRVVAWPLTALMCNVLADGGSAFVLTRAELAQAVAEAGLLRGRGVRLQPPQHSARQVGRPRAHGRIPAARRSAGRFERAGIGAEDIDLFEIYGSYPGLQLVLMDALGMAPSGMTPGELVASGETSPGGKYPTTTNGEALGFGHTGTGVGFSVLVETVRQLQGKAGAAQVPDARFAVENCGGGAFMDIHFSVLTNEVLS